MVKINLSLDKILEKDFIKAKEKYNGGFVTLEEEIKLIVQNTIIKYSERVNSTK